MSLPETIARFRVPSEARWIHKCASTDAARYVLNTVAFDLFDPKPRAVSCDGRVLAWVALEAIDIPHPDKLGKDPILVGSDDYNAAWKAVGRADYLECSLIRAPDAPARTLRTQAGPDERALELELVDLQFPNYRQVLPAEDRPEAEVSLSPDLLATAFKAMNHGHRDCTLVRLGIPYGDDCLGPLRVQVAPSNKGPGVDCGAVLMPGRGPDDGDGPRIAWEIFCQRYTGAPARTGRNAPKLTPKATQEALAKAWALNRDQVRGWLAALPGWEEAKKEEPAWAAPQDPLT